MRCSHRLDAWLKFHEECQEQEVFDLEGNTYVYTFSMVDADGRLKNIYQTHCVKEYSQIRAQVVQ